MENRNPNRSCKNQNKSYALQETREYKGKKYGKISIAPEIIKQFGTGSEVRFFQTVTGDTILLRKSGAQPPSV